MGNVGFNEWDALISKSCVDPLFNGYAWQEQWWTTYSDDTKDRVEIPIRDKTGTLEAVIPAYFSTRWHLGCYKSRAMIYGCGNTWNIKWRQVPVRTEHNSLVATDDENVLSRVLDKIAGLLWDELILSDWDWSLELNRKFVQQLDAAGFLVRKVGEDTSHDVDTVGTFDRYLTSLSANVRRSIYNKRRILEKRGPVAINRFSQSDTGFDEVLSEMNRLHAKRWGKSAVTGKLESFHRNLAASAGTRLELSRLECSNKCISILLNHVYGRVIYNFQAGFDPRFDQRLSPMLLHLGYEIEEACRSDIDSVNLLAGSGKNSDFKLGLATGGVQLRSFQVIRNPFLKVMYATRDSMRRINNGGLHE